MANVLTNAAKYTDAGGHIRIETGAEDNLAVITISDNGVGIARLRAIPELHGLQVIAVTGYGQGADKSRARAAGIVAHLVKPIDFAVLRDVLAAAE